MKLENGQYIEDNEIIKAALELNYEELVVSLIRDKYTIDDEIAILRQKDTKKVEFDEYNSFCESCKVKAKDQLLK